MPRMNRKEWRETAKALIHNMVVVLAFLTFVIRGYTIPSSSMENTLKPGDRIFVLKFFYGIRLPFASFRIPPLWPPHRGDVIVFKAPHEPHKDFIKRTIGLPGETVLLDEKLVQVNQAVLEEPYTQFKNEWAWFTREKRVIEPHPVPSEHFFMMGDNRDNSKDSRYWGYLPFENVKGRAVIIYWPISRFGLIK